MPLLPSSRTSAAIATAPISLVASSALGSAELDAATAAPLFIALLAASFKRFSSENSISTLPSPRGEGAAEVRVLLTGVISISTSEVVRLGTPLGRGDASGGEGAGSASGTRREVRCLRCSSRRSSESLPLLCSGPWERPRSDFH